MTPRASYRRGVVLHQLQPTVAVCGLRWSRSSITMPTFSKRWIVTCTSKSLVARVTSDRSATAGYLGAAIMNHLDPDSLTAGIGPRRI